MELVQVINDYLKKCDTDFAILIDGKWGSGKTHFIKQQMKAAANSEDSKKGLKWIYVSLYGISSTNELNLKVISELLPFFKSKFGKGTQIIVGKILSKIGYKTDIAEQFELIGLFKEISKDHVLVFDDLERMSTKSLNEVLGYINSFTEHKKLKVIIVADESELKKYTAYDTVKEKLIRFTYHYNPNIHNIYQNFIDSYEAAYRTFLKSKKELVVSFFRKASNLNLRTLRFILDLFEKVHAEVTALSFDEKLHSIILERLFAFMISYSIEFKKGAGEENLLALEALRPSAYSSSALHAALLNSLRNKNSEPEKPLEGTAKFNKDFFHTYFEGLEFEYFYFASLSRYIHTGEISKLEIENMCSDIKKKQIEIEGTEEYISLKKLKNILVVEDKDCLSVLMEVIAYAQEGKYFLTEYDEILYLLWIIAEDNTGGFKLPSDIIEKFKEGMIKSVEHSQYDFGYKQHVSRIPEIAALKEIRDFTNELNDLIPLERKKEKSKEVMTSLTGNDIQGFEVLIDKEEPTTQVPIFQKDVIDPSEFYSYFLKYKNFEKVKIIDILGRYGARFLYSDVLQTGEFDFWLSLKALLEIDIKEQVPPQVNTQVLKKLLAFVDDALEKYKKVVP